jgi:hypothetical protein
MTLDVRVRHGFLDAGIPAVLVDEVMEAFAEAKRRYYRDDLRPSAVEGGRFTEAVFRVLDWAATDTFVPLGKTLPGVDSLLKKMANAHKKPDSVRLHIPRTLRLIYDVRNRRDVAHLGDGIDPNQQDAALVIHNMEWVLAELVRLYHKVSPAEAHGIITELVSKDVPLIQVFDGFPRVLRVLRASDHVLVLLYWRGTEGATFEELHGWVRSSMRRNLRRTLAQLDAKDRVHLWKDRYVLTALGENYVADQKLLEPQ